MSVTEKAGAGIPPPWIRPAGGSGKNHGRGQDEDGSDVSY